MEFWSVASAFLTLRLEQFGASLAQLPLPAVLAALALPILLAVLARQLLASVGAVLLVAAVFVVDPSLSPASVLVAIESYVAAVLIGCLALQSAYRNRKFRTELESLSAEVEALRRVSERRFMSDLNAQKTNRPVPEVASPEATLQPRGDNVIKPGIGRIQR